MDFALQESADFWAFVENLVASSRIAIDRPKGSAHPRYPAMIYPFDYGYLENTQSGDGEGIDVWIGSGDRSCVCGMVCTIDLAKRDMEMKILLGCTAEEARAIVDFLSRYTMRAVLMPRHQDFSPPVAASTGIALT